MWDEKSVYSRIETSYVLTKDMNDELVEKLITQTFNQGSAILKIKYHSPKSLVVEHLFVKERVKKMKLIVCVMEILFMFQLLLIFKRFLK